MLYHQCWHTFWSCWPTPWPGKWALIHGKLYQETESCSAAQQQPIFLNSSSSFCHFKEDYENVNEPLQKVNHEHHNWDVCGDFRMLGFFSGLQGGHTKYFCFLCLSNSSATDQHYVQREWPARKQPLPGTCNVVHKALVPTDKILQLRIKPAPVKQYVKT